jgi:hypothetical protein
MKIGRAISAVCAQLRPLWPGSMAMVRPATAPSPDDDTKRGAVVVVLAGRRAVLGVVRGAVVVVAATRGAAATGARVVVVVTDRCRAAGDPPEHAARRTAAIDAVRSARRLRTSSRYPAGRRRPISIVSRHGSRAG